jgi:Ca2+-binding EF-hand superfamily protein
MKSSSILLTIGLLALALPANVHAAKDPAKKEARKAAKAAIALYDKNGNGIIDGDEVAAIQKAYEADKTGPLKAFDLNNDGKLDDAEVAAIHAGKKAGKLGKKKTAA